MNHDDKIALVGDNELAHTTLYKILTGELEPDEGTVKWGQTVTHSYFPKDNSAYFNDCEDDLVEWLRQYSSDPQETYLRGFLGSKGLDGHLCHKVGLFFREEHLEYGIERFGFRRAQREAVQPVYHASVGGLLFEHMVMAHDFLL